MGSRDGKTYDETSVASICEFARLLVGKTLAEAANCSREELQAEGKGGLGVLVETKFFDLPKSNKPTPDFEAVGLELKTTALTKYARRKGIHPKENLKLTSLNPHEVDGETWETSRVVSKCGRMLIVTHLYEKGKLAIDMRFTEFQKVVNLLDDKQLDAFQFKQDWETIQSFIRRGLAHELSSGSTSYLIANTSGAGHGSTREQPHSSVPMSPRSFMIKKDYLDYLLTGAAEPNVLITTPKQSIETSANQKLRPYTGLDVRELANLTGFHGNTKTNKGYYAGLVNRLLGAKGRSIPEFEKAGIKLKTIRLDSKGRMTQEMSFKNFRYVDIVNEDWEESTFFEEIQRKFLFVVFAEQGNGTEILLKAGFWNMPYEDREEAGDVWRETKRRVQANHYSFPAISETRVAHVRPHGKNKEDKYPTPQGNYETKNGFWLNKKYLQNVIENL